MSLQIIFVPTHCWERLAAYLSSPKAVRRIANINTFCQAFSIKPKDVTKYSYLFREVVSPKTKVSNKKHATKLLINKKRVSKVIEKPKTKTAKG